MTKHEEIAETLTNEILSERFLPGERLPSERDLAARFDANRGAVREAMKKVAQMGLATIQPGGARVEPIQNASLDVIGCMLAQSGGSDPRLIAQILEVMNSLVQVSAEHVINDATDAQIEDIRTLLQPLIIGRLDAEERALVRMKLMQTIMLTSHQLICQLIARSLFEQLIPNVPQPEEAAEFEAAIDQNKYRESMQQLDRAFADRDVESARVALRALEELNRAMIYSFHERESNAHVVEVSIR